MLSSAAMVLLLASFVTGSVWFLVTHLLVDALVAAYVALLLQVKQQQAARVARHHTVDHPTDSSEPQIRIVANS
jgi:hypothetical protein